MTHLLHKELTHTIIGVYYDVYNGTGRTYPEYIYENAMMADLQEKQIPCHRQPEYKIYYKDRIVGAQRLDLFIAGEVVVELKAVPELKAVHKAQAMSYLKVVGKQIGLVCNFGSLAPQFERVYYRDRLPENGEARVPAGWPDGYLAPELTYQVIGALFEVHNYLGPGFIYRIYGNALYHELRLRGLAVIPQHSYQVIYRERPVGAIKFEHLQIDDRLIIFPVAIQNIHDIGLSNLKAWLEECRMPLGVVANFHASRLEFMVLRPEPSHEH